MNTNRLQLDNFHQPIAGRLLVSTERLNQSGFERAVVLLMQDDQQGSFGVVLNKPVGDQMRTAWEKLTGSTTLDQQLIVAGGPLQGPVLALHQIQSLSDVEMSGGLYVSAQIHKLQKLLNQQGTPCRIVVGLAGWQPGQLKAEIEAGCWYELPLDVETVFDDPVWMWESCLHDFGRQQISEIVGNDIFPDDPTDN